MSIDEVERTILIKSEAPFSHSAILQPEIDTFHGSFEHNQRFKEFEGLIKANHRIYEALELKIAEGTCNKLKSLANKMDSLANRIESLAEQHFQKEELKSFDLCNMVEVVRIAETKQKQLENKRSNQDETRIVVPALEEVRET